jgi:hypothetical protein
LTITPSSDNITTVTACDSYTWNGTVYTTSGIKTGTTTNCVTEKLNLTINASPTSFSSGGINYVVTSPTTVAVGINEGASGTIIIPSSVSNSCGTYAVTGISDVAFSECTSLTSVTIPNTVTSIGEMSFLLCSSLTSVTIGNSVTSIGNAAFYSCSVLTSVTIPDAVISIGTNAFAECTNLTSVLIGNSVTSIGNYAFNNCSGLTSVTISNS